MENTLQNNIKSLDFFKRLKKLSLFEIISRLPKDQIFSQLLEIKVKRFNKLCWDQVDQYLYKPINDGKKIDKLENDIKSICFSHNNIDKI